MTYFPNSLFHRKNNFIHKVIRLAVRTIFLDSHQFCTQFQHFFMFCMRIDASLTKVVLTDTGVRLNIHNGTFYIVTR